MGHRYAWSRSSFDEVWYGGPCDSIQECVREASAEGYKPDETIAVGFINDYEINQDFAWRLIEDLQQDAFDECGDAADSWLDYVTREERDLLNCSVTKAVKEWLKTIKQEPYFYSITPYIECTLSECLEKYYETVSDISRGGKVNVE